MSPSRTHAMAARHLSPAAVKPRMAAERWATAASTSTRANASSASASACCASSIPGTARSIAWVQGPETSRHTPLAEFAYADFAQREISRLEDLRLTALEDRIQSDLECGCHAEVIGELESLVAEDPMRERPRAQLMLALYRSGRQAEALEAYGAGRRVLVAELGIEPGRELKELQAAILEQDPALDLRPPVAERRPGQAEREEPEAAAAPSESFIGRERELAEFRAAFSGALAGLTSLFLIAGEPGIGKSRLADELASLAQAGGARVCWGRCWEAGGAPAYWPWVQALRAYIREADTERIREQLAPGAADIAQMLPELHGLFPDLPPPPSLDPEGARFRLFDSTASSCGRRLRRSQSCSCSTICTPPTSRRCCCSSSSCDR